MKKIEKIEKRVNSLVYNHIWLKYILDYGVAFIATVFSAAIFAFGVNTFLDPTVLADPALNGYAEIQELSKMVSGGSSGAAQVVNLILQVSGVPFGGASLTFSIAYLLINLPLVIVAFKGVGKRFGLFTLINVGFVFLFTNIMHGQFFVDIAIYINENAGMLGRALFAGMCTGVSSAVAFKIDASAGGFDIISYYISQKKSTLAGKYAVLINACIISSFALVSGFSSHQWSTAFAEVWFSLVYLLTVMLVIDIINIRNKKAQIQIITTKKELPKLLLANIPHGATLVNAKGVYTDTDRYIVYLVLSTTEVRKAVKIIKELDPESFVNVTALQQVYGNFHTKPVR